MTTENRELIAKVNRSIKPGGQILYNTLSWMLTGPKGIQIKPQVFAAFFPGREGEGEFHLLPVMPGTDIRPFVEKILSLQIPPNMRNELGAEHPAERKALEDLCSRRRSPSIVVELGEEVINLHHIPGMTHDNALTKVQQEVQKLKI